MTVSFICKMLIPNTTVCKYPTNTDAVTIHKAGDLLDDKETVTDWWFDEDGLNLGVQR